MVWRVLVVENPGYLRSRDRQLEFCSKADSSITSVPLEDIACIVVCNPEITISGALLSTFSSLNIIFVSCDDKYTPNGVLLPLGQHSRTSEILALQIALKKPVLKRFWQRIVKQKILNQSLCLKKLARPEVNNLAAFGRKVDSGDTRNVEAQAARFYWPVLFGHPFRRGADTAVNAALNYGYSILRSAVARGLVARGLNPSLGVHHRSKLNAFNLVDDFMEPFRPLVDFEIASSFCDSSQQFDRECRLKLIALLQANVLVSGESNTVLRAIEVVASSYVDCLRDPKKEFLLPNLIV